jgi:hypothetical protein
MGGQGSIFSAAENSRAKPTYSKMQEQKPTKAPMHAESISVRASLQTIPYGSMQQ